MTDKEYIEILKDINAKDAEIIEKLEAELERVNLANFNLHQGRDRTYEIALTNKIKELEADNLGLRNVVLEARKMKEKLEAEIKNLREAGQADGDAIVAEKEKVDKLEAKLSHAIDCMDSDGEADHKCWVNWKYKEEKI